MLPEADCNDGFSHEEKRRLYRCRAAAFFSPVAAAAVTVGLAIVNELVPSLPIDGSTNGVMLANCVIGSVASIACGVLLHPYPRRPLLIAVGYLMLAPAVYAVSVFLFFVLGVMALAFVLFVLSAMASA